MQRRTERRWVGATVFCCGLATLVSVVLDRLASPARGLPPFEIATSIPLACQPFIGKILDGRQRTLTLFGWRRLTACRYPDQRLVVCSDDDLETSLHFCSRQVSADRYAVLGVDPSHYYDDNRSALGSITIQKDEDGRPQTGVGALELHAKHAAFASETVPVSIRFEPARFVPAALSSRRPWAEYDHFLSEISACGRVRTSNLLGFATSGQAADPHGVTLLVRHDIDHDLVKALKMRQLELAHAIPATYFVLLSASYFGARDAPLFEPLTNFAPLIRHLASTGAEIGLHSDELAAAYYFGGNPETELEHALAFLRGQGLDIRGTASHGFQKRGPAPPEGWFLNDWIFRGRPPGGRQEITTPDEVPRHLRLGAVDMQRQGLAYEAYALHFDYYLSDVTSTRQAWVLTGPHDSQYFDELPAHEICELPAGTVVQLLTHPEKWAAQEALLPLTAAGF